MLCDNCGERPAAIHITQIADGEKVVKHLCTQCASDLGMAGETGMDLGGLFEFPDIFSSLLRRKPDRIYDYFSEDAQKVLQLSREEAKRLNHDYINPEHLLLGLIKEEGNIASILKDLNIDLVQLFSEIESFIGHGENPPTDILLSPRTKKVLELAYNSAKELGFNYVGPEHFLIGILKEGESIAAQALGKRKITAKKITAEILKSLQSTRAQEEEYPEFSPENIFEAFQGPQLGAHRQKGGIAQFSRNLTQMAKENKIDPVIGREKEIDRVIRILSRRTKNNPALLGDPGVGKTAIVEGLAQRIIKGDIPEILKNKEVVTLDLTGMIAGTKYRGEFEARIKKVMDEIIAKAGKYILFIDELHTLVGAGAAEGAIDAANILKPALAKGDLHVIGATTVEEYRKYIEKDSALERRFQPIMVDEPTVEETIEILKGIRDKYEAHHRVKITDDAIFQAAHLADRYITDRFLPDKAIDLMDEAAAKVRLCAISPPKELREAQKQLEKIKTEKEAVLSSQQYEKAAEFRDKIADLESKVKTLDAKWKSERGLASCILTKEDIAEVVHDWTGVPVIELTAAETERLIKMEEVLHERVVSQEEAIHSIAQAIRRGRAGLKAPERPVGSFIFAGPTGVGKTEVAKRLAEFLFGSQESLIRIDMSEYMEKHTTSRIIGAPPGYVGYEEGGTLTEQVRRKPYSVLLFDEIEKAHPDVFNILLQILDDGRLTDSKGRTVDFKNTIIIMTTNIGAKMIAEESQIGFLKKEKGKEINYDRMKTKVLDEMKHDFKPEFLNRIDEIIVFHSLTIEQIKKIADIQIGDLKKLAEAKEIKLDISEKAKDILAKEGYEEKYGARPLKRAIQKLIENPLSNDLLAGTFKAGDTVIVDEEESKLVFKKKK